MLCYPVILFLLQASNGVVLSNYAMQVPPEKVTVQTGSAEVTLPACAPAHGEAIASHPIRALHELPQLTPTMAF